MTRYQLGAMIARTIALIYIIKAVSVLMLMVPLFAKNISQAMDSYMWGVYGASLGMTLALAVIFWFGANFIGRALAGKEADAPVSLAPPEGYLALVFVAAGCWMLTQAIHPASQLLSYAFVDGNFRVRTNQLVQKGSVVGTYVLLSAVFIFGSGKIARVVTRRKSNNPA